MCCNPLTIFVLDETGNNTSRVVRLKERLSEHAVHLSSAPSSSTEPIYTLAYTVKGLELRSPDVKLGQPFSVDFSSSSFGYRLSKAGGKSEDIARAIGLKKGNSNIIDATCGFAKDSFVLASLGCTIELCERSPITHALVEDALVRARQTPEIAGIAQRITLHLGDSMKLIPRITASSSADVIYLDPMYPHRTKSALVKKQMRILRHIVGKDNDADLLHTLAQKFADKRVVCKRPASAPFFNKQKPNFTVKGKKHRFDVYLVRQTPVKPSAGRT